MTHLPAFKASAGIASIFCSPTSTARKLHDDLVTHEKTFMILGDTFFRSFTSIEFLYNECVRAVHAAKYKGLTTKPYPTLDPSKLNSASSLGGQNRAYFSSMLRMVPIFPKQLCKSS